MMQFSRAALVCVAGILAVAQLAISRVEAGAPQKDSPGVQRLNAAFQAAYNLDYDRALTLVREAVAMEPGNSRVQRGLASILWLRLLFDRGGATVDQYLGEASPGDIRMPKPDPVVASEFTTALGRAIEIAERRFDQNPNDLDAMYDVGAAYGVKASYQASVEGSITGALQSANRAFDTLSRVLERDPARAHAGVVLGGYRYAVSTLPVLVRGVARIIGFPGDKEVAISLLENASHDPRSRVDAKSLLIVIFSREGRHHEALRLARELSAELPDNRLFVFEAGAAAIRAGRYPEADTILTTGLLNFEQDKRRKIPGEHALWLYKRGLARIHLNRTADAALDLRRAIGLKPEPWVAGRIQVALGNLEDLAGRRTEARAAYQRARAICQGRDPVCSAEARQYLSTPFGPIRKTP
jgi:tetratricopeptide (TPR) repeat protein